MTELHHYTLCGLDYVYLRNGYDLRETRHGPAIAIHDAVALHQAIARAIITNPQPLRGQEVRFLRSVLKLSQAGLARVLRNRRLTVARWEAAPDTAIPGTADAALRLFCSLKIDNHALAQQICDLLTEIDDLKHQMAVLELRETERGWEREAA
ncbi:MAG TPA: hypothetical protein VG651_09345 [Stellaceae bacterium]|nr:hypothetical protein [Stellaceae bacterium]